MNQLHAPRMAKDKVLSIDVNRGSYNDFVQSITTLADEGKSAYACMANVHMLVEAHLNASFAQTVNDAAVVAPDGKPIAWALFILNGLKQERVDGMTLLPDLLKSAQEHHVPVYFYGSSQTMLQKTQQYLDRNYPSLIVAGMHSPPFRALTQEEEQSAADMINASGAKLVFVVLGCPKQEKWMAAMKGRINAFMVGVGGALPVLIGEQSRAPKWMQASGMEWLYRLGQEPKRLFKRYAVTNTVFLFLVSKALLRKVFFRRQSRHVAAKSLTETI